MHQGLNIRGKEFNYKKPKAVALGFFFYKTLFLLHRKSFHELGGEVTFTKLGVFHQFLMEGNGRLYSFDDILIQSSLHLGNGFFSCLSHYDELGYHGIVMRRYHIPSVGVGI